MSDHQISYADAAKHGAAVNPPSDLEAPALSPSPRSTNESASLAPMSSSSPPLNGHIAASTSVAENTSDTPYNLIQSNVPVPPLIQASAAVAALPKTEGYVYPEYQWIGKNKATGVGGTAIWASLQVFNALEFVGEVFADFFGLYDSQYEHIVRAYERDKKVQEQQQQENSQVRQVDDPDADVVSVRDISLSPKDHIELSTSRPLAASAV